MRIMFDYVSCRSLVFTTVMLIKFTIFVLLFILVMSGLLCCTFDLFHVFAKTSLLWQFSHVPLFLNLRAPCRKFCRQIFRQFSTSTLHRAEARRQTVFSIGHVEGLIIFGWDFHGKKILEVQTVPNLRSRHLIRNLIMRDVQSHRLSTMEDDSNSMTPAQQQQFILLPADVST